MRRRVGQQGLGFGAKLGSRSKDDKDELRALARTEDLVKFGMIPEFMGRLPIIVSCDELDVDALTRCCGSRRTRWPSSTSACSSWKA